MFRVESKHMDGTMFAHQKKNYILAFAVFVLSISSLFLISHYVDPYASMDASYYHLMANQLEKGKGFEEPIVWNHLNSYQSLEHPMDYWMPLGIIAYYLAKATAGANGEVWLNMLLWSLLSTMVFFDVYKHTGKVYFAFISFVTLLFSGRNVFYLLTCDNIAFYAFLGYLFIRSLSSEEIKPAACGLIAGLIALTRIDGIIFAFFGFVWILFRRKGGKTVLIYLLVLIAVLSPWFARNYLAFGKIWTSSTKAIFIQQYEELFWEDFPGTLDHFMKLGPTEIFRQKLFGLWNSLLNLVAVPGIFILYPLWLLGLIKVWQKEGKFFAFLIAIFWFLCGFVFTHQSIKGTSMHISAFFYPHYAILNGIGFCYLIEQKKYNKFFSVFLGAVIMIWAVVFSLNSVSRLSHGYKNDNEPYQKLFSKVKISEQDCIVSAYPVYVYHLSGNRGVICSSLTAGGPTLLADKFACNYILMDSRAGNKVYPEHQQWENIASGTYLELFRRKIPIGQR